MFPRTLDGVVELAFDPWLSKVVLLLLLLLLRKASLCICDKERNISTQQKIVGAINSMQPIKK